MIKEKVIISAIFFIIFMICSTNLVLAEDENIILSDPQGDVLVYNLMDVDYNFTTTDEVPNIDIKELSYIHNDGSTEATIILQVYGKIEDRGSLDETNMGDVFDTVAYAVSLTTTENSYLINYVNKTCALTTSDFESENITDWSVNNDKLIINIELENSNEEYVDLTAETTDIDIDFTFESGGFYFDTAPNLLFVEIEVENTIEEVGDSIQFNADAQDQYGASGDYTYTWDFGDGSPISKLKNPSHKYNSIGNYTVTLTVEDDLGNIGNSTTIITITEKTSNGNGNGNGDGNGGDPNQNGSESGLNLFITIIAVIIIIGILVLIFIIRR
jgi:PKD repeat protein